MELNENRDVFCGCQTKGCKVGFEFVSDEESETIIVYGENGKYTTHFMLTLDNIDVLNENLKIAKENIKIKQQLNN